MAGESLRGKVFEKLRNEKFVIEEKWVGIYYILKDEILKHMMEAFSITEDIAGNYM